MVLTESPGGIILERQDPNCLFTKAALRLRALSIDVPNFRIKGLKDKISYSHIHIIYLDMLALDFNPSIKQAMISLLQSRDMGKDMLLELRFPDSRSVPPGGRLSPLFTYLKAEGFSTGDIIYLGYSSPYL